MIGFSDVKAVIVGAKKVVIYIKRTPPRILRGWFIASLLINGLFGWLLYWVICENIQQAKQVRQYYNQVILDKRDAEAELKRLRKKVERP